MMMMMRFINSALRNSDYVDHV